MINLVKYSSWYFRNYRVFIFLIIFLLEIFLVKSIPEAKIFSPSFFSHSFFSNNKTFNNESDNGRRKTAPEIRKYSRLILIIFFIQEFFSLGSTVFSFFYRSPHWSRVKNLKYYYIDYRQLLHYFYLYKIIPIHSI